jgi:tetratricopeptide (TPR) repeat protein
VKRATWATLAAVVLAASPARSAPDENRALAKKLTASGMRAYKVGHFQEALDAFAQAYQAFPAPLLLFDIGQCHRGLGHAEQALFFLRNYLHDAPDAKNRQLVEQLVDEEETKLRKLDEAVRHRQEEEREAQARDFAAPPVLPLLPLPPSLTPRPPASAEPAVSAAAGGGHPGRALEIAGLTAAAVGAVAVGVGIAFGVRSAQDASNLSGLAASGGTWTPQSAQTYSDGSRSATVADVLYAAGGAAIAAGAVCAFLGWRSDTAEQTPSAAIVPSGQGASVVLSERF